jgi:hypothetical protein
VSHLKEILCWLRHVVVCEEAQIIEREERHPARREQTVDRAIPHLLTVFLSNTALSGSFLTTALALCRSRSSFMEIIRHATR